MREEVKIGREWYELQGIDKKAIVVIVGVRAMWVSKAQVSGWRKKPR